MRLLKEDYVDGGWLPTYLDLKINVRVVGWNESEGYVIATDDLGGGRLYKAYNLNGDLVVLEIIDPD